MSVFGLRAWPLLPVPLPRPRPQGGGNVRDFNHERRWRLKTLAPYWRMGMAIERAVVRVLTPTAMLLGELQAPKGNAKGLALRGINQPTDSARRVRIRVIGPAPTGL